MADEEEGGERGADGRLTKPKAVATSKLERVAWPDDARTAHVLVEMVTIGSATPKVISLASRVLLPGGAAGPQPFHSYVKTDLTASKTDVRSVHGLDLASLRERGASFADVGKGWLAWLAAAVPSDVPCVLCMWGGLTKGHFTLLPLELQRHGLALPTNIRLFLDLKLDVKVVKKARPPPPATSLPALASQVPARAPASWATLDPGRPQLLCGG